MVETRRTSRRLQAKAAATTSPHKASQQTEGDTQSDEAPQEIPATTDEETEQKNEVVVIDSDKNKKKTEDEEEEEEEEVEEEIMLLDEEQEEEQEDEDEDVDKFAFLAASGIHFSTKTSTLKPPPTPSAKPSTAALKRRLVPNQLDSGASQYKEFFSFDGTKHATAATLRADARTAEEAKVVAAGQKAIAHSERQRAESLHKKSAGRRWFNFESDDMSEDARRDFALLRMRNYLDPKKFYKSSDHSRTLPKHFQMGVVVEGAAEFHSARLTKKQRRKTFTDEIMADGDIVEYTTRVAINIQRARSNNGKNKKRRRY